MRVNRMCIIMLDGCGCGSGAFVVDLSARHLQNLFFGQRLDQLSFP